MVSVVADALCYATSAVAIIILIAGCALIWRFRTEFPVAQRTPWLVMVGSTCTVAGDVFANFVAVTEHSPCWFFHATRSLIVESLLIFYLRVWIFWVNFCTARDRIAFEKTHVMGWYLTHTRMLKGSLMYAIFGVLSLGVWTETMLLIARPSEQCDGSKFFS